MLNLLERTFANHRTVDGTPAIADTNMAAVLADFNAHGIQTDGFDSLLVGVTITGGAGPASVGIRIVYSDGTKGFASTGVTMLTESIVELKCFSDAVYIMLSTVTGAPTKIELDVMGAKRSEWMR